MKYFRVRSNCGEVAAKKYALLELRNFRKIPITVDGGLECINVNHIKRSLYHLIGKVITLLTLLTTN